MLRAPLQAEPCTQGLLITRCPSVHGFFMRYAIDVVYLATADDCQQQGGLRYTVTHLDRLEPWRISVGRSRVRHTRHGRHVQRSAHALELPAGSIERLSIEVGDELKVSA